MCVASSSGSNRACHCLPAAAELLAGFTPLVAAGEQCHTAPAANRLHLSGSETAPAGRFDDQAVARMHGQGEGAREDMDGAVGTPQKILP